MLMLTRYARAGCFREAGRRVVCRDRRRKRKVGGWREGEGLLRIDEAEIFIAFGGRVGPLWKLSENLSRCLALRDCHTHLLISAGIGWAGTLSGRLAKVWSLYVLVASSVLSAYQETAALAWPGQEPKRIPSCPGYPGGLVQPIWELSKRTRLDENCRGQQVSSTTARVRAE